MVATNTQETQLPPAPKKMVLDKVVKGRVAAPVRITIYGVEGIGKSTLAAHAPKTIVIPCEKGTDQLDVARFPQPESWADILDAVRVLTLEEHDYKTLAIDTIDAAEPLLWKHVCKRDKKENIEAYGYGKGYGAALDEWRVLVQAIERLQQAKKMNVIFVAHSWIKTFKNPDGEDYDRHEMKLHSKISGQIREWSDAVLFANLETLTNKEDNKRAKGVSTGARLMYTVRTASFDAKNRYDLPPVMPLSWTELAKGIAAHVPADPALLTEQINKVLADLGETDRADGAAAITRAAGDASKLAQLKNWAMGKHAQKVAADEAHRAANTDPAAVAAQQ